MTPEAAWRIVPMENSHVETALTIHSEAFAGYAHVALGRDYLERMFAWYMTDPQAVALTAMSSDGTVAGYVFGTDQIGLARYARDLRGSAIRGLVRRPWLLFRAELRAAIARRLGWTTSTSSGASDEGAEWSLVGIAVSSPFRGTGCGAALVTAFEGEAVARGAGRVTLSVYSTNVSARRLYEAVGWVLVGEEAGPSDILVYERRPTPAGRA